LSLLGTNVLLSTLFSDTLSLSSSLSVSDKLPHPYETKDKIIVLCILANRKQKILHRMIASIPWLQSALNFFLNRIMIHFGCSQIFELFNAFKGNINTVTSSYILVSRHDLVLNIINIYSFPVSLLATTKQSVFFLIVLRFLPIY
jgi:hypothetical protein